MFLVHQLHVLNYSIIRNDYVYKSSHRYYLISLKIHFGIALYFSPLTEVLCEIKLKDKFNFGKKKAF